MCEDRGKGEQSAAVSNAIDARDISSDETGSRSAIRVWVKPGRGPRRLIHATRGVRGGDRGLNARVCVHRGVNSRSRFVHTVPSTLGARVDPALDTAARRYSSANCHGTLRTLRPWERVRSPGRWVLSHSLVLISLPFLSLAGVPAPPPPALLVGREDVGTEGQLYVRDEGSPPKISVTLPRFSDFPGP